jgi:hypothetical protein
MKNQNNKKIIYSLIIEDAQTVARQEIERELTPEEIENIKDSMAERIPWYDAISDAITEVLISNDNES